MTTGLKTTNFKFNGDIDFEREQMLLCQRNPEFVAAINLHNFIITVNFVGKMLYFIL